MKPPMMLAPSVNQVGKGAHLSREAIASLRKNKLVEGRVSCLYLSADVAESTDQVTQDILNRGFYQIHILQLKRVMDSFS